MRGVLQVVEGRLQVCPQTFVAKPSYLVGLLVVRHRRELTPDPCLTQRRHSDRISTQVHMLLSSNIGDRPSPG